MNTLPRRYTGVPGFNVDDLPTPSKPAPDRSLIDNHEFLADCARYLEGVYTRAQVKKRWRNIDDATWDLLGDDNELVDSIELERTRRIRSGEAKKEKAQLAVIKAPGVLEEILLNSLKLAKHRIDSAKALDHFAGNTPEAKQQERVIVTIRLGKDEPPLVIDAAVKTNDPNIIDHTPQELPPPRRAITDNSDE